MRSGQATAIGAANLRDGFGGPAGLRRNSRSGPARRMSRSRGCMSGSVESVQEGIAEVTPLINRVSTNDRRPGPERAAGAGADWRNGARRQQFAEVGGS